MRRWKCTSVQRGAGAFRDITTKYMDALAAMGYPEDWRRKVLESTLRGYMRILAQEKKGVTMRNRTGKCTAMKRKFKRTVGKQTWFRPGASDPQEEIEVEMHFGARTRQSCKGRGKEKYI